MASERGFHQAFFGVSVPRFAASAAVTIVWSMSASGEMPTPSGWTMSRMAGRTWPGAAASFPGMWVESGPRPFEIERQMLIAQSSISRLIDRLVEQGYVERRPCEEDGRGQHVVITPAGREMRRRMWPVYSRAISEAVGHRFSEREAKNVASLLTRLVDRG
jgi:DNA-binding MarR family transcriptional regulator